VNEPLKLSAVSLAAGVPACPFYRVPSSLMTREATGAKQRSGCQRWCLDSPQFAEFLELSPHAATYHVGCVPSGLSVVTRVSLWWAVSRRRGNCERDARSPIPRPPTAAYASPFLPSVEHLRHVHFTVIYGRPRTGCRTSGRSVSPKSRSDVITACAFPRAWSVWATAAARCRLSVRACTASCPNCVRNSTVLG
jgi:hypothetical protein